MLKFNNTNIFTGYIKQLLADFRLPKYRVYTKDLAEQEKQYKKNKTSIETNIAALQAEYKQLNKELNTLYAYSSAVRPASLTINITGCGGTLAKKEGSAIELTGYGTKQSNQFCNYSDVTDYYNTTYLNALIECEKQIDASVGDADKKAAAKEAARATWLAKLNTVIINKNETINKAINEYDATYGGIVVIFGSDSTETKLAAAKRELIDQLAAITKALKDPKNTRPQIIATEYRNVPVTYENREKIDYPERMRYVPYIKDGFIKEYTLDAEKNGTWHTCHKTFNDPHLDVHSLLPASAYVEKPFILNGKDLNYTKSLVINSTSYDSYTHEYLGDYLRFMRDYQELNLMSLYNCFSNRLVPQLNLEVAVNAAYTAKFNTTNSRYKIYMVPVKMFKDYTIALNSASDVEICCGIYGEYLDESEKFINLSVLTYQCFSCMQFSNPVLYTKISELHGILSEEDETELAMVEDSLKLFIKVPEATKTAITILEGNYLNFADTLYYPVNAAQNIWARKSNHSVINFENKVLYDGKAYPEQSQQQYEADIIPEGAIAKTIFEDEPTLYTPLQLLTTNTGESYPFADRLIEYLIGNAITGLDENFDNIQRTQTVVQAKCNNNLINVSTDGIWDGKLKLILYDFMGKLSAKFTANHDILGYVDKDVEQLYAYKGLDETMSIASVDIYGTWED